jgi:hypothetical protein
MESLTINGEDILHPFLLHSSFLVSKGTPIVRPAFRPVRERRVQTRVFIFQIFNIENLEKFSKKLARKTLQK